MNQLPPLKDQKQLEALKKKIAFMPARRREDAIQEAWLAHLLEKPSVMSAVKKFDRRESNWEKHRTDIPAEKDETKND